MANMGGTDESVTVSHLQGLIKQKRNAELKSLLLREVPSSLINKRESTLIHAAVMFNNVDIIALLFGLGFNINARNSIGQTPMMLAAQNNSYQAVQLLLALDADVLVADADSSNALRVLLRKDKNTPAFILGSLFERLKRSELSSDDIARELVKVGCPLEHIFTFNDADMTREMLILADEKDEETLMVLLKRAMYTIDMVNVKVLLEYEPHLQARRKNFFDEVTKDIFDPATKPFFEQLVNWSAIDEECMDHINKMFKYAGDEVYYSDNTVDYKHVNENVIKMFLDIGTNRYCREKFGYEVFVSLFVNSIFDATKLIKNRQFDINGRDKNGNTALHVAVENKNIGYVAYLLDKGVDPNIKNRKGQTPLFFVDYIEEMAEHLLESGADLQIIDTKGCCAFDELELWDFVLIKLMILEFQGLLIKKIRKWLYEIDSSGVANKEQQEYYDKYIQDLDWMSTRMVSESISLFFVVTEKFDRLARYVKDEKTCTEIRRAATSEREIKPAYTKMLMKNLAKACKLNELKSKAAKFLCAKMQIVDCDHLIIEKIVGYLTYKNLLVFEEMEEV